MFNADCEIGERNAVAVDGTESARAPRSAAERYFMMRQSCVVNWSVCRWGRMDNLVGLMGVDDEKIRVYGQINLRFP